MCSPDSLVWERSRQHLLLRGGHTKRQKCQVRLIVNFKWEQIVRENHNGTGKKQPSSYFPKKKGKKCRALSGPTLLWAKKRLKIMRRESGNTVLFSIPVMGLGCFLYFSIQTHHVVRALCVCNVGISKATSLVYTREDEWWSHYCGCHSVNKELVSLQLLQSGLDSLSMKYSPYNLAVHVTLWWKSERAQNTITWRCVFVCDHAFVSCSEGERFGLYVCMCACMFCVWVPWERVCR